MTPELQDYQISEWVPENPEILDTDLVCYMGCVLDNRFTTPVELLTTLRCNQDEIRQAIAKGNLKAIQDMKISVRKKVFMHIVKTYNWACKEIDDE